MRADVIKFRLFLEGVLIPKVSSVSVTCYANEQATATFEMPSIPGFETEELKRARVHIYWSDVEIRETRAEDEWPILFDGEIIADSYDKSVSNRRQIFHCAGLYIYWQQVKLYYYNVSQGPGDRVEWSTRLAVLTGNSRFEIETGTSGVNITRRLVNEIRTNSEKPYHSIVKKVFRDCMSVNHFFSISDEVLNISGRVVSVRDENLDMLIDLSLLTEIVDQDVLAVSGNTAMLSTLKSVLNIFRYQIINNSQPVFVDGRDDIKNSSVDVDVELKRLADIMTAYMNEQFQTLSIDMITEIVTATTAGALDGGARDALAKRVATADGESDIDTKKMRALRSEMTNINIQAQGLVGGTASSDSVGDKDGGDLLSQFLLVPDTRFAIPPACNVIFPGDQMSLSMSRQLLMEPTRGIGKTKTALKVPMKLYVTPAILNDARVPRQEITPASPLGLHPPITAPHRITSHFDDKRTYSLSQSGKRLNVRAGENKRPASTHQGIDLGRPVRHDYSRGITGATVYAVDDGVVKIAGQRSWAKKNRLATKAPAIRVLINHGNGTSSHYNHLRRTTVKPGQVVSRGQVIGEVGNTGVSSGPHLHFEFRIRNQAVDPLLYFDLGFKKPYIDGITPVKKPDAVEKKEKSMADDLADKKAGEKFLDYRYLTPEEKITGIIPFFDYNVIRAHAFMNFTGDSESIDRHYMAMLDSEFFWRRYQTRSLSALSMPFNASPAPGFPALIVDRIRSIIGLVASVSHVISVGSGGGTAMTTVQLEAPRYWDEGDPYYWRGGEPRKKSVEVAGADSKKAPRNVPDPDYAKFPTYYLQSLVPSNSSDDAGAWSDENERVIRHRIRDCDRFYQMLLGVNAVPYQYAEKKNVATQQSVSYNAAVDGRDGDVGTAAMAGGKKYPNTIVGRYYNLLERDQRLAGRYTKSMTRRLGMSERDMMVTVLRSKKTGRGAAFGYDGPAFRSELKSLVRKMNLILAGSPVFRG